MQLRKRHLKNGFRKAKHCFYCGVRITVDNFSVDHVMPLSRNGEDKRHNKVLACRGCNGKKADFDLEEYRQLLQRQRKTLVVFWGERA